MEQAGDDVEQDESYQELLLRRCAYCSQPLFTQRKGAVYHSRRCKELAREKRKRDRQRVATLRENHPFVSRTLDELYAAAARPEPVSVAPKRRPTQAEIRQAMRKEIDDYNLRARPYLDRMRIQNTLIEPMPLRQLRAAHEAQMDDIKKGRI